MAGRVHDGFGDSHSLDWCTAAFSASVLLARPSSCQTHTAACHRTKGAAMQGLRRGLIDGLRAAARVCNGATNSSSVDAVRFSAASAAQLSRWALPAALTSSPASAAAPHNRWSSTAAAPAVTAEGDDKAARLRAAPATRHQALKLHLKPQVSGRLEFKRNWQRKLQIKVRSVSRMGTATCPASMGALIDTSPLAPAVACSGTHRNAKSVRRLRQRSCTRSGCSSSSSAANGRQRLGSKQRSKAPFIGSFC